MENREAFFALIRAGLWDNYESVIGERLAVCDSDVLRLSEEQSVIGLMAAGVEKLLANSIPLTEKLMLLGKCQLVEQRNAAMNSFVAELIQKLHETGIKAVLLKGQGVAQCYAKPQWRLSGDVDLLFNEENYRKAKRLLLPMASESGKEFEYSQHLSLTIGAYIVELHGSQRCGLSGRMDAVIDKVQREVCENGKVRTWMNGNVPINLPAPDEDVILVFTHLLKHFYKEGIGLRQICDWCRLLWTFREKIDSGLLETRLGSMGLMTEWKAFGAFAVDYLGMPVEALPLYDASSQWVRKAEQIEKFIMMAGNFGHNRNSSYWTKYPYMIRKALSMKRKVGDLISHARIFPLDSFVFFPSILWHGLRSAARGE